MNTPYSMALGWGSLLLAGGVSYYYAKKDINTRRDAEHQKRLAHTSGVALARHQYEAKHGIDPSLQPEGMGDQAFPGQAAPRYRLATGNSTEGRDRGDRL